MWIVSFTNQIITIFVRQELLNKYFSSFNNINSFMTNPIRLGSILIKFAVPTAKIKPTGTCWSNQIIGAFSLRNKKEKETSREEKKTLSELNLLNIKVFLTSPVNS